QAACAPFVERAIALVRPKILMLAGGASAKHLLKTSEGILSLRGRWFEWRSEDGRIELPALPTLHPAFLLRQPAAQKKAWEDLQMLRRGLIGPRGLRNVKPPVAQSGSPAPVAGRHPVREALDSWSDSANARAVVRPSRGIGPNSAGRTALARASSERRGH